MSESNETRKNTSVVVIHCDLSKRALSKMGVDEIYIIDPIVTY